MKVRLSITIFLALIMFSGQKIYSQDYKDLKKVLSKWESVMKYYSEKMNECTDLELLSANCIELADSVTVYHPLLTEMKNKYPDIDESQAPEELKGLFSSLELTNIKYSEMLNYLVKLANSNSENEAYQSAFMKLNMAIYNSNR